MELVDDLINIQKLSKESFEKIIHTFATIENDSIEWAITLKEISKEKEDDQVASLVRFLDFLSSNLVDSRNYSERFMEIDAFFTQLTKDEPDAKTGWEQIKGSLGSLENFFLYKKEEEIKDRFSRITYFSVTTDIRPIFDLEKRDVIKSIYPNILKIQTSDDREFICELYEETLDLLIRELENTKYKLKTIKEKHG